MSAFFLSSNPAMMVNMAKDLRDTALIASETDPVKAQAIAASMQTRNVAIAKRSMTTLWYICAIMVLFTATYLILAFAPESQKTYAIYTGLGGFIISMVSAVHFMYINARNMMQ